GLELDVQRQRHPMWEWLFSHPIPPGAAFFAEMLAPLAANPVFAAAPVFWCFALRPIYGVAGALAGIPIGAAMGIAASCFSKALEIAAVVRLPPRSRGAAIGILSWLGYSAFVLGIFSVDQRGILVALVWVVDHAV